MMAISPLVGSRLTGQNSQKCGLAGAVGSDQAVAVALGELDVHVLKQCLFPHPEGYVVCTNHNTYLSFCLFFNRFPAPSKNALRSRPGGPAGHFQVRVCALMKKGVCRPLFSSISDCTGKTLNLQGFFGNFPFQFSARIEFPLSLPFSHLNGVIGPPEVT